MEYAAGIGTSAPAIAVGRLRHSAELFPLDYRFRKASALYLARVAIEQGSPQWEAAALPELYHALRTDATSVDLQHYRLVFERAK